MPVFRSLAWTAVLPPLALIAAAWAAIGSMLASVPDPAALGPGMPSLAALLQPDERLRAVLGILCRAGDAPLSPGAFAASLWMWISMTAAMMLPCALPGWRMLLRGEVSAGYRFLGGFLACWLAFAVGAAGTATILLPAPDRVPAWLLAAALALAGAYQFTAAKRVAADERRACPLPSGGAAAPLRAGLAHGWICLRSDGPLMALMIPLGAMNVVAMLALLLAMAAERVAPRGAALHGTGLGLLAAGIGVLLG